MAWFLYRQNNSGGIFDEPAVHVYVEADDTVEADRRAEELGIYFNGVESGYDCECCGDRWDYASSYSNVGEDAHEDLLKTLKIVVGFGGSLLWYGAPFALFYHKDGTKEQYDTVQEYIEKHGVNA